MDELFYSSSYSNELEDFSVKYLPCLLCES
jgi:hypothetical protein